MRRQLRAITRLVGAMAVLALTAAEAAAQSGATATLSVLSPTVEWIGGPDGARRPAQHGMDLAAGDRVKTGEGGLALVTFLDGSTVTVQPGSEVTVKQADRGRDRSGIRLIIHVGRVWARVARGAGGGLSLESNEYAATAHDGLIGAEQAPDGAFVCWTRRGEVRLTDRLGQGVAMLMAGQRARALMNQPVSPEPFRPTASTLEVRTEGPVVPLLRMPDGQLASGFTAPGTEVNQVFGSLTDSRGRSGWIVEVPAGLEGPYTLVLTGTGSGAFAVKVAARYGGVPVYRQELKGIAAPGQRQVTRITQGVDGRDPRTARVLDARFDALRPLDDGEPASAVGPGQAELN